MRPDGTALCSLALVIVFFPVAGVCLLPVFLPLHYLLGVPLWASYVTWAGSVLGYGLRPAQLALARLLWPLRRPTAAERRRLDQVWFQVLANAALPRRRIRLRVVDLAEVNAHSVGRDLICVTSGALARLGDRELAGVLAHELGHHLRMHTAASAFLVWVLLPLQGVALFGVLLALPFSAAGRRAAGRAEARAWDGDGDRPATMTLRTLARGLDGSGRAVRTAFAAPGMAAFAAKNAAGRRAEYLVDAFAVEVGLGGELLSALRWFAAADPAGQPSAVLPVTAVLPAPRTEGPNGRGTAAASVPRPTHPPLDQRMARIAAGMGERGDAPAPGPLGGAGTIGPPRPHD